MIGNFEKLPLEEQRRILDACIDEFASHPYRQASTNAIVQRAGIPKGTLFYYFGSKRGLFVYIFDLAVNRYLDFYFSRAKDLPSDLFERILAVSRIRMEFLQAQPRLYHLFFSALIDMPDEIRQDFQGRFGEFAMKSQQLLMDGLDRSRFKEGVNIEHVISMIQLLSEGILTRYGERIKALGPEQSLHFIDELEKEFQVYFEMIKNGVYKETPT